VAKLTKKYNSKKAKNLVRFKHEANRRFRLKHGIKRSKAA
jgi:hypothetical protein